MNIIRFLHTVRSFQADQIRQKMVYSLAKSKAAQSLHKNYAFNSPTIFPLSYTNTAAVPKYYEQGRFTFLNTQLTFNGSPPWNEMKHGILWNMRLNSFEYLLQENIEKEKGVELLRDFISHSATNKTLYDSYTVSQRIINWTSFLSRHSITDEELLGFLYRQACYLASNPEYHLRNNHLLENGFALMWAALFFQDAKLRKKAERILVDELKSQILRDGAHFELSPMYHCIVLRHTLETIELLNSQGIKVMEYCSVN